VTLAAGPSEQWDSHLLLLYRDQRDQVTSVASWVRRGLERGDKIFYSTVPGQDASMPVLTSALEASGDGVARAMRDGQFVSIPLDELFPGARQPALTRGALAEGYSGVRFSAQANAALRSVGEAAYKAIDRLMDELCASSPVSVLCQYDAAGSTGTTLRTVLDSHPDAVLNAQMRLRRLGDRVVVVGEVDFGSAEVLASALHRSLELDRLSELVLDVAALTFVDGAACRAVVTGTSGFRRAGGTVFVRGTAGHVHKVMMLAGMDRLPGIVLV
jgi:anti-anti-sigma factor